MRHIFLIFIVLVFSLTVSGQKDWLKQMEKIKPLKSTEQDVEKIIGKPTKRYADVGEYETKNGLFTVTYSQGRCKSSITPKYDVLAGIVVKFDFSPRKKYVLSSLKLNLLHFTVTETSDVPGSKEYINVSKGRNYSFFKDELNYIEVYPSENLDYLICSNTSS